MDVKVVASGSAANSYILRASSGKIILLDCGTTIGRILTRLDYYLPDAVFITHEHSDHARLAKEFLNRGVDVFMTKGTADALKLRRHNLYVIEVGNTVYLGNEKNSVEVLPSYHDAAEPVNFIVQDETDRLLYLTDTGEIPEVTGKFTKILIEANHSRWQLLNGGADPKQIERILANHLCVEKATEFLKTQGDAQVWLIHISTRHANPEKFAEKISEATDVKIMKY